MARSRAHPRAGAPAELLDTSPARYIARVSLRSGKEIPGPVDPSELLVHAHRDNHPVEVAVQFLASRLLQITGNEDRVRASIRAANSLGNRLAAALGWWSGSERVESRAKKLLGAVDRYSYFRFRESTHLSEQEVRRRVGKLQHDAGVRLKARGRSPRLYVLLTGATGFLGKEIIGQAASDRRIEKLTAVVRPETVRDRRTGKALKVLSPQQRGALLLKRLGISGRRAGKYDFIAGDIERPDLGIAHGELARLRRGLTHVVHCAASVSFDDSYESSYRANVLGCRNALAFSLGLQQAPGSAFVQHVAIETSYVHGRKKASMAAEDALDFPRHFYNNFYELTKAMASIETDRFLIEKGLRVAQLLPSIVIGNSRTGNNRGDTKVVNAPINAFGRSKQAVDAAGDDLLSRARARVIAALATSFPGDPSAELNLVPVDRVAAGILAALTAPASIGTRIHLATDNRIRSQDMVRITREELGINVRLSDPTFYRNVTLPVVKAALDRIGEPRLAAALEKLGTIFGGYSEWGQPVYSVGNDVRILGLPIRRPSTEHAFRMLCRHNRYVQEYGKVRDPDEIARREGVWERAIDALELESGHEAGAVSPEDFRAALAAHVDLASFRPRPRRRAGRRAIALTRRRA